VTDGVVLEVTDGVAVLEEDQDGDTDGLDPYPACKEQVTKPA
jgi:hypothetical protein